MHIYIYTHAYHLMCIHSCIVIVDAKENAKAVAAKELNKPYRNRK